VQEKSFESVVAVKCSVWINYKS